MIYKFKILHCVWIMGLLVAMHPINTLAATKENAVKAGFIYNFTKFIKWPVSTNMYASFNVCLVGDERLEDGLQALEGKTVGDKKLSLRVNVSDDNLRSCQMLFVATDEDQAIRDLMRKLAGLPVVTVSDSPDFILKGGMIGLIRDGNRLGFEVNLVPASKAGIQMSSQLLKLSKSVKGMK